MRASTEQVREIGERAREVIGGSVEVEEWEIAVMHRTQHAECCRVSWLQGDIDAMTEALRVRILPELEQVHGFCSVSLLVNRSSGLGCVTTAWESRAAMEASRAQAGNMRSLAASEARGDIVDVHEFELAFAHLHVAHGARSLRLGPIRP